MFLILTRDRMLVTAIAGITGPDITVHIHRAEDICPRQHLHACVIIDTFRNNILYTSLPSALEKIAPSCIYILSPFGIKNTFANIPVRFIPRNISVTDFYDTVIQCKSDISSPPLFFSRRQHEAASLMLQLKNPCDVTKMMNISKKTLSTHEYHVMCLLKLRRFSRLLTHRFADYFFNDSS